VKLQTSETAPVLDDTCRWDGACKKSKYVYAPHNDISVNDGPHIGRWSRNIIIYYSIII